MKVTNGKPKKKAGAKQNASNPSVKGLSPDAQKPAGKKDAKK